MWWLALPIRILLIPRTIFAQNISYTKIFVEYKCPPGKFQDRIVEQATTTFLHWTTHNLLSSKRAVNLLKPSGNFTYRQV
jgi:hypothetical protein